MVDRGLPRKEFVDRKHITTAGFLKREQATAHGRNHLGLAPDDLAFRIGRGQVGHRQWAAVRADHILGPLLKRNHHENSHAANWTTYNNATRTGLKISYEHRTEFKYV
jgi:hypothetical protein